MAGKMHCDPADVLNVQAELAKNVNNLGVGVVNLPTGVIRIFPYDDTTAFVVSHPGVLVMTGHEAAATMAGFVRLDTRGFALGVDAASGRWQLVNLSHLNKPDGGL